MKKQVLALIIAYISLTSTIEAADLSVFCDNEARRINVNLTDENLPDSVVSVYVLSDDVAENLDTAWQNPNSFIAFERVETKAGVLECEIPFSSEKKGNCY